MMTVLLNVIVLVAWALVGLRALGKLRTHFGPAGARGTRGGIRLAAVLVFTYTFVVPATLAWVQGITQETFMVYPDEMDYVHSTFGSAIGLALVVARWLAVGAFLLTFTDVERAVAGEIAASDEK